MMRVGIAGDHGEFVLKGQVAESQRVAGYEIVDFGAHQRSLGVLMWRNACRRTRKPEPIH
jgi:hypothetical protein